MSGGRSANSRGDLTARGGSRDPFLDVIRAFAMVAVVANHMTFTLLFRNDSGSFQLAMLYDSGLPWLTWPFIWELQAFFLPAAALSFRPALRGSWRAFIGRRMWRLVFPVLPLAAGLVLLETTTRAADMGDCATWAPDLTCATAMPISPLWFIVVLVPLTALSPILARWWFGPWKVVMPMVVVAIAAVSDILWVSTGSPLAVNGITVWALVWFAGFAFADGTLDAVGTRTWWLIVGAGTLAMAAGMTLGPYAPWLDAWPRSMMSLLETVVGVSLLMALRGPISGIRDRPIVDLCVRRVGGRIMGVYLWHYFAFAVVISAAGLLGVDLASGLGWPYLAQRAVIIPLSLLLLALLLRVTRWVDGVPYPPDRRQLDLRHSTDDQRHPNGDIGPVEPSAGVSPTTSPDR